MKTATKVIFTSALMLSGVAPTLSYAAYFVDQTKTWATNTPADVMGKKFRIHRALDAMAYARYCRLTTATSTPVTSELAASTKHSELNPDAREAVIEGGLFSRP